MAPYRPTFGDLKAFFAGPTPTQAGLVELLKNGPTAPAADTRASPAKPKPQTYVRDFASKHNIDLTKITPESAALGLTLIDVADQARAQGDMDTALAAIQAQVEENNRWLRPGLSSPHASRRPSGTVSRYAVNRTPVDAMARNPLVDQVRASARAERVAAPGGSTPTLFASGDLPAFTASGIPPSALLEVPWQARHAMAAASTSAEAYAIQAECSGSDAEQTAQMLYGDHPGNGDYADRVERWRVQSMTDNQLEIDGSGNARVEIERRAAAISTHISDEEQAAIESLINPRGF
jgi:hypothetical protein